MKAFVLTRQASLSSVYALLMHSIDGGQIHENLMLLPSLRRETIYIKAAAAFLTISSKDSRLLLRRHPQPNFGPLTSPYQNTNLHACANRYLERLI